MTPGIPELAPLRGFFYPYRGLKFLFRRPGLLGYVAIPFAINTALYTGFVWFAGSRVGGWIDRWVPRGDAWYWTLLYYALWTVVAAIVLLLIVYTFTVVGNLLLAPFNDLLSEKVERVYAGKAIDEPFRFSALLADAKRSFKAEAARMLTLGSGFVVLLVLSWFLPPVGLLLTMYTLFLLAWEYLDYSMERWRFPFSAKTRVAGRNALVFLGFGAGSALLLAIPVLNFLAIPVCVTGATLLFCDLRERGRIPASDQGATAGTPARPGGTEA